MLDEHDPSFVKSGEHLLWLNVIDRAVQDYTRFYDWVVLRGTKPQNGGSQPLTAKTLWTAMQTELYNLQWFFFAPPEEFNFAWIFAHVFSADEDLLTDIRKKLRELHLDNAAENKDNKVIWPFIAHISPQKLSKRQRKSVAKLRWHVGPLH